MKIIILKFASTDSNAAAVFKHMGLTYSIDVVQTMRIITPVNEVGEVR